MDEKKIVAIVRGLLTGDGDIIQPIVDQYFTDDIVFEHPLFTVKGKADYYKIYRGYYAQQNAAVELSDFIITDSRAVISCTQYEKPRFFPTGNLVCKSTILLHFRKDKDGVTRIDRQTDHWSNISPVLWSVGGYTAVAIGDMLMKPFNKTLLCVAADLWDLLTLKKAKTFKDTTYAAVVKAAASGALSGELEDSFDVGGEPWPPVPIGSHALRQSRMSIESFTADERS